MRGPENTIKGTGTTMEPGTTMGAQEHKGAWGQQWGPHYKGPRDHKGCLGSHNIRAKGPQKGLETTMGPGDHNGIPVTRPEEHKGPWQSQGVWGWDHKGAWGSQWAWESQ